MNSKLNSLIAVLGIISCSITAQQTPLKYPSVCKPMYQKYNLGNDYISQSLDCYNTNGTQPCFLFNCTAFPDSVKAYEIPDNYLAGRRLFSVSNNTVKITHWYKSQILKTDLYYYSKNGLLDSAILESEADGEYDEYAIKHIYTYKNNLPDTDLVYVDNVDNSVSNDWEKRYIIKSIYNNNRLSNASVYFWANGQFEKRRETRYTYSDSSAKGYLRTDTVFSNFSFNVWQPEDITINYFNNNDQCNWIKNYRFSYTGKPDSLGALEFIYRIDNEYDNSGNLKNSLETRDNSIQPSKAKYVFEEKTDKNQKLISIYGFYENFWELTYQYTSYYSMSALKTTKLGNQDITLSPNPTNDFLKFNGIENGAEITIYATDGKLVLNKICYNNTISVKEIPAGTYILRLRMNNNETINRLFVKR